MVKVKSLTSLLLLLFCSAISLHGQSPSLFMSDEDFVAREKLAVKEQWAGKSLALLLKEADDFPRSYTQRFGLNKATPPAEGGQWLHWYACPESGRALEFQPPDKNICPDTGKNYSGYPYDHVVYQMENDALGEAAIAEALAFRFTSDKRYAQKAASILNDYVRVYPTYALHDINGKPGPNGGKAFAQTLDESIWLIKIAWTYDLIRNAGVLTDQEKQGIEVSVLRASAAVVLKAHKEPTYNIQSWINCAAAAVGFTLNDEALIKEAIDGPLGFRHQMHTFVQEGFWAEGAWGYQFYAMRALTMLAQMATKHGINLWQQEPNLVALFHSPLGVVLPDGRLPAFNDSGSPDLYEQDFLYEVAYAATHDSSLLAVLAHAPRSNREAFLFGAEHLPGSTAPKLASALFPEAGYATLRAGKDTTVIMKFGPHGSAHGHYDKLNFVLFSHGRTLAIDPGAHPYGLAIHKEWDAMTIAHNTISVDEQRQAAATGKLLDWHDGKEWAAVSASSGPAYSAASLRRSVLVTAEYVLIVDHCDSLDGKPHTYDWAYHNAGNAILPNDLKVDSYSFTVGNGYQRLGNVVRGTTSAPFQMSFHSEFMTKPTHAERSNSTPATYRFTTEPSSVASEKDSALDVDLQTLPSSDTEIFTGNSSARDVPSPVSFVILRRKGTSVTFATLLRISTDDAKESPRKMELKQSPAGEFVVQSSSFIDTFSDKNKLNFQRQTKR